MDIQRCTTDVFKNQRFSFNEQAAHDKGYRVWSGKVFSPAGNEIRPAVSRSGYLRFGINIGGKKKIVMVHRLAAYQKFGELIYNVECIRHKDGTRVNNEPFNLRLGNQRQNMNDRDPADRKDHSIKAATALRKFTDAEMEQIRSEHKSYRQTMQKWGISSKGTLHHILNHEYITRKAG